MKFVVSIFFCLSVLSPFALAQNQHCVPGPIHRFCVPTGCPPPSAACQPTIGGVCGLCNHGGKKVSNNSDDPKNQLETLVAPKHGDKTVVSSK